jgi:hypothetical protein
MHLSPRLLFPLALSVAFPISAGCSGNTPDQSGVGGATGGSSGDGRPGDMSTVGVVSVSVGSGVMLPPGVWMNHYGDAEDQHATALAVNGAGDIALAGTAKGTINFGNIPWTGSTTDTDVVVAKISSEGQAQWSRRYGDSCDQRGGAVALAPSGDVLLAGDFCGKMSFGNTTVETKGGEIDLFVALIDELGEDVYSRSFGGAGAQIARAAAVDTKGNAVIVGSFDKAFDDGTGEAPSAGMDDVFVIKLDPNGKVLWTKRFGGPAADLARTVAVDEAGNIVVGGSFGDSVDFGGGPLTAGAGHSSGFVVELDPGGKHLWSKSFGTDADAVVNGVAVGPSGNIAATGFFVGTADFGSGPSPSAGAEDVFLAMMNSAGNPVWGRTFGGAQSQRATGVTFGVHGDLTISGTSDETFDLFELGTGFSIITPFAPVGPNMTYAVRFDATGKPTAGWVLESTDPMESVGVGFDENFRTVLAGSFQKTVGFQFGPIESAGGWDMFVAREF